jgi:YHS domain-containing protein
MRPLFGVVACAGLFVTVDVRGADAPADAKAALQALNEFIGDWKGTGGPDRPRPDPKDSWSETISWSWRFKVPDARLQFDVKGGKYLSRGEVRYLPERKKYQLTAIDAKQQKLVFEGQFDAKGYLTFERTDPATGETQQLVMNSAGDGVRFVYRYAVRPKGRTVFTKLYQVAASKEGESLAASGKKNECVVTGGTGTIAVTFMGETFYVCCSGCRDAFNEEPAKYVAAYKEKKKK